MSVIALSPVGPEPPSPMVMSITPTLDPDVSDGVNATAFSLGSQHEDRDQDQDQDWDVDSSPGPGPSRGPQQGLDLSRSGKCSRPPPLHTGADWKVVLHLPEIEKWLRATSARVTQLSHSVGQDTENRHVDVHLVQLKDICEDISDHVEQIHALLETEFSLKLLSYSVNIIVDIRTVQLLWHQLRVSVLVLKERLLQGLQDPNGNYTRQTDILQAFSQDQHQTRLDALTDVDDCGQLTIRCSQDYFSLDCGITAFELSDYSPSDDQEGRRTGPGAEDPGSDQDPDPEPGLEESQGSQLSNCKLHNSLPELTTPGGSTNHAPAPSGSSTMQCGTSIHSESAKRPLQGVSLSTDVSPTQPSLPKRAALFSDGGTRTEETRGRLRKVNPPSGLQFQAELSRSTPSLMDPPDRAKFWLELHSVYPEHVSHSYESLQVINVNLQRSSRLEGGPEGGAQRPKLDRGSPSGAGPPPARTPPLSQEGTPTQMERPWPQTHAHSEGGSDSTAPSPVRDTLLSSDPDASGEESDPRPPPAKNHVWMVKRHGHKKAVQVSSKSSANRDHWYGSEEFLALPDQLRKTEMLAMNLESLAQTMNLGSTGCDSSQDALQDVDDWDLTELNPDWDIGESGDDVASPLPPLRQFRRNHIGRFSPASSSDTAPSMDESIESGPLSDLASEDGEGQRTAECQPRLTAPLVNTGGSVSLIQQLLEDVQRRNKDPDVWKKIECFVQQLDGFIWWLQEALDSTENWTQPRQDLDSLRAYLDTHLSFKLNVDSRTALKDSITEEGRALLSIITSHQSALKDILQMVSGQWDQLQRQIRRQHAWMLRALRCIQARLFYAGQSHEAIAVSEIATANRAVPCSSSDLQVELISSQFEAQRAALEQMAVRLSSLQYPPSTSRRQSPPHTRNYSLQEFEAEYQELWDWLMDMDAMVTDSHQLMMSEEQRHHLFKSSHAELMAMETRKTSVLARAESLKRSGSELPAHFHRKVHNLTHTWTQLEKILSEHSRPGPSRWNRSADALRVGVVVETPRSALSPLTNSLLEQLEARIKELKAWLRDTELLIFNSCLRQDKDASAQLGSFKSLCSEIQARRRGVSSVLKLCRKLLQQSQSSPLVEVGPEAEQHQEALQLLSINLERRWEAIVMQALQWQNRLKRELGEEKVPGKFLEPGLVDLHQLSPVPAGSAGPPGSAGPSADDSWEWDETDMTITEPQPQEAPEPDLTLNLPMELDAPSDGGTQSSRTSVETQPTVNNPPNNNVYQVYSLHNVELYQQPHFPCSSLMHKSKTGKQKFLLKSLSKDSSFSSIESLPDILGGLIQGKGSGRRSGQSASSRRSGSESGIDTGDTETIMTSSEIQGEDEDQEEEERRDVTQHHQTTEENLKEKVLRRPRRGGGEAVEILINGRGILTPADSDSDFEIGEPSINSSKLLKQVDQYKFEGLITPPDLRHTSSPVLSQGSSLESLLALGVELFPNCKEVLHRSTSLETCLVPGRSPEGEAGRGTTGSLWEVDLRQNEDRDQTKKQQGEPSSGELSRRTLDLLKRLENIQSPLTAKMTRSVSDMTLRRCSSQRLPASPSLGGRHAPLSGISHKGPPSLINESSATASLTELSSNEDSSLGSEDFAKNQRHLFLDPTNGNSYRRKHGNSRAAPEEADAASLSMVVNVSACTDEDEDDSDLLSSSTLTLTEEELGIRDGEDEEEERLSGTSSANDEDDDEEDMEGSYVLGLEYMKRELQGWIRTPRTSSSSSKTEAGLRDELQCGTFTTSSQNKGQPCFINRSPPKFTETNIGNQTKIRGEEEENRRNATRSYISQFVDDVENGNVDQSCLKGKDEDDELLREESSVFTKKGEGLREPYLFAGVCDVNEFMATPESTKQLPFLSKRSSSLVGQLRGELPCHSSTFPSPPSLSPVEDCRSHDALCSGKSAMGGRKAINIQEKFKFSSIVTEETKREVRDKKSSLPPKKRHHSHPPCCSHLPSSSSFRPIEVEETKMENVHDFVMEIIDMTSLALKSKENQSEEPKQAESDPDQSSAPLTQIRDKVLEHSHRPLHLRKGDFYNYLSLSSHDSDCGEVVQCSEEKGSTPAPYAIPSYTSRSPSPEVFGATTPLSPGSRNTSSGLEPPSPVASLPPSPDIHDKETLFSACTEEVYLGPPLCYSMALPKKPRRDLGFSEPELDRIVLKPIEYLNPDGGERQSYQKQKSPPSPVDYTSLSNLRRPPAPDTRRGEDLYPRREGLATASAGVGWEGRSGNEGPSYLNPSARVVPIDSSAAQCLADTKTLESNMGAVMTKISVCSAATNPSKEPAATATRINPKINYSAMREADMEEGERRGEARGGEGGESRSKKLRPSSQLSVKPPGPHRGGAKPQ